MGMDSGGEFAAADVSTASVVTVQLRIYKRATQELEEGHSLLANEVHLLLMQTRQFDERLPSLALAWSAN